MTQIPDTQPGNYYVSMIHDGQIVLLRGPFRNDHASALAAVNEALATLKKLGLWGAFDDIGTARMTLVFEQRGCLDILDDVFIEKIIDDGDVR